MAGTMNFGIALVLLCTVVSTVNCRMFYSPNVDQLPARETDNQRVRRDSENRVGIQPNDTFTNPPRPMCGDLDAPKVLLCRAELVREDDSLLCGGTAEYRVQWTRSNTDVDEISVYQMTTNMKIVDGTEN